MKTINDLNETLFKTMDQLAKGEIEVEVAKQIVSVSGQILDVAKIQLDAVKNLTGNISTAPLLGLTTNNPSTPPPSTLTISDNSNQDEKLTKEYMLKKVKEAKGNEVYDLKTLYAKKLNYNNLSEAIGDLTARKFEKMYLNWE